MLIFQTTWIYFSENCRRNVPRCENLNLLTIQPENHRSANGPSTKRFPLKSLLHRRYDLEFKSAFFESRPVWFRYVPSYEYLNASLIIFRYFPHIYFHTTKCVTTPEKKMNHFCGLPEGESSLSHLSQCRQPSGVHWSNDATDRHYRKPVNTLMIYIKTAFWASNASRISRLQKMKRTVLFLFLLAVAAVNAGGK